MDFFGLRPLNASEKQKIVEAFYKKAVKNISVNTIKKSAGPLMLPSHIHPPKLSYEALEGKVAIGVDVGGTNLRIGTGRIKQGKISPLEKIIIAKIGTRYKSLEDFFKVIFDKGLKKYLLDYPDAPLACIFSFPGIGILEKKGVDMILPEDLTKEWAIERSSGSKMGVRLNNFLQKNGIAARNYLFDNDTVALIKDDATDIGIVCATGYNLSFVYGDTIINTEAGSADTAPEIELIASRLKKEIASDAKRDEYQISGKYLGPSLAIVAKEMRDRNKNIFLSVKNFNIDKSFVISDILSGNWPEVMNIFKTDVDFSKEEKSTLTDIASFLRDRSAQIVACHIIGLKKGFFADKNKLVLSSDGPVIQKVPGWTTKFFEEIAELTNHKLEIIINETKYQDEEKEFRGIFDVMYQTIEYFARKEGKLPKTTENK